MNENENSIVPLKLNQKLLTYICACTQPKETPWHVRVGRQILVIVMIILLIFGWISSIVFIVKYVKTDLSNALYAIFQIAGEFSALYTVLTACIKPEMTLNVFLKFKRIREQVIDYTKDGSKCFKYIDYICYKLTYLMGQTLLTCYITMSVIQGILNIAYCYYRDNGIDPQCLFVPYKFSSPWNQNSLKGRSGTIIFCIIQAILYIYVSTTFVSFFISISLQFNGFRIYLKGLVDELDIVTEQNDTHGRFQSMLCNIVYFHVTIKDLFWSAAEVFNKYIFVQVISAVVFMSSNLMNMDLSLKDPGTKVGIIFFATIYALGSLYLYCAFGDFTTRNFAQYTMYYFQLHWYELPVKYQKYVIRMISNSNLPMTFNGFGIISLNLKTFLKINKTAASYYLVLKTVAFE